MATPKSSPVVEASAAPSGFSYAQAAKRKSLPAQPTPRATNNSPEAAEAQKDVSDKQGKTWADETEENLDSGKKDSADGTATRESSTVTKERLQPSQTPSESQITAVSVSSTPEFGISSTSTLAEKEDASSIPNASSESTWESKSQASNPADKSIGSQKEPSLRNEDAVKESAPLKEAPPPPVNVWQQRAKEQQAAKTVVQGNSPKATSPIVATTDMSSKVNTPGSRDTTRSEGRRKARSASAGPEHGATGQGKDRKRSVDVGGKIRDDAKFANNRRGSRFDHDTERNSAKNAATKSSVPEQEEATVSAELPSVNDETSWPAMGTNIHEEKQRKPSEKEEKERVSGASSKAHGKQEWVQMAIPQANYLFDTPLPNTSPRRGGRGGSRGGRENASRGGFNSMNGYPKGEKTAGSENSGQSSEALNSKSKREKSEGDQMQGEDLNAADTVLLSKESADSQSASGRTPAKASASSGADSGRSRGQFTKDSQSSHNYPSRQSNVPKWKQSQRNGDFDGDRRRESEGDAKRESRRASIATQMEEPRERRSTITGETIQGSRYDKYDRREEYATRSWKESGHESYAPRGGGRGRGRGSRRGGFQHGFHQGNHNAPPAMHASAYPFPTSPTYPQHFGGSFQPSRGYRGQRMQSVPNGDYGRASGAYSAGPGQMPPLQTWFDSATTYDYQMAQSASAMPWTPQMESFTLVQRVIQQLEYYLSLENMLKDTFLRSHMDSKGYLDLEVVANFNRLKGYDMEMIKLGCYESLEIDFRVDADGKYKIRKSHGWEQWVLDMDKRQPNAQNEGSDQLTTPPRPQPPQLFFDPFQYGAQPPTSPGHVPSGHGGYTMGGPYPPTSRTSVHSYPCSAPPEFLNPSDVFPEQRPQEDVSYCGPNESQQQEQQTSANPDSGPRQQEPDSFPDDKIPGLNVVYRVSDANNDRAPYHSQETRTFSNGSIDGGAIASESRRSSELQSSSRSHANGAVPHDGENNGFHINRVTSSTSTSLERTKSPQQVEVFWVKDSSTPVDRLPLDTESEPYGVLHLNALNDRFCENPEPCSRNMLVLYQFWSHFLIRNFNTIMYNEFRKYALEDATKGSTIGINNLIEFYGKSLSSQFAIRDRVARHYIGLVKDEDRDSDRSAFHQLRKQWRDGALNMKNRKRISDHVDRELRDELEN